MACAAWWAYFRAFFRPSRKQQTYFNGLEWQNGVFHHWNEFGFSIITHCQNLPDDVFDDFWGLREMSTTWRPKADLSLRFFRVEGCKFKKIELFWFKKNDSSLRIPETEFVLIVEASARAECLHFLRCYQMLLRKTVLHDGEIWNFLAIFKIKNLISVLYIVFKTESDFQNFTVLICHFKCFLDLEEEEH